MELRVLNYFLTVAREKTISRAAEVLHLSQPTLSKQLKEFEEALGVKLFIRGNRFITLTEEGIYLANKGKEIVSLVESTTANLLSDSTISGQIAIGAGETRAFEFIGQLLRDLRIEHPDIHFQLHSGNADDVLEKIDHGLLDFGLVIDPIEKQKYDSLQLPLVDYWGILVHSSHPLAKNKSITPTDIEDIPLLVSSQSFVDKQLAEWLGKNSNSLDIVGTYNLLYNASLLVKENMVSALCIDGIINTANTHLTFIPFSPSLTVNVNMIWKKNQTFSNASNAFLRLIRDVSHDNGTDK
ncbi:LysR family transcriptional regulator [Listeria booriae]|uniref:LysR family transcriptional regulator n=1 Tax=Listeria booriae TaxID=1552123 RepID=A0A7X0XE03_9LIST|nr:LysR family transcriptional regulator [Listeria booriae]MBC1492471.1 LysR family transcriptional regulator [Listeria booriae]MBC1505022.1 LysR family transcriptional regulator [Listeria booriae]MBC1525669.1 LysR family transcriptional regulator [Listeria booriae]MBC6135340.1 LysR family transcriptional regulator [Listeria booriae]